ncbi:hypothetical protein OC835_001522 [Tilletia horrida]|nr:hypothetical protein OC835_001522 [Tilletia horrida]
MPKSRFRINKAARNDPLARPSGNKRAASGSGAHPASSAAAAAAAQDPSSPAFAVSLLNKLSLPATAPAALLPLTEAVWTLSALGSHIGSKPIRTALLHPNNHLGQRILHALDPATYAHISGEEDAEDRLALLTQASGVLRNLCIDAPWGVRDNLGKQGLVSQCVAVLQLVIYGQEQGGADPSGAATSAAPAPVVNKPLDQMNRKEKRHAAKAAAAASAGGAASASGSTTAMDTATTETASKPAPPSSTTALTPAFLAASPHTLPLLDNILTLLWCLAESSSDSLLALIDGVHLNSHILDEDRARAQLTSTLLADTLLGALQVGLEQSESAAGDGAASSKPPSAKPNTARGLLQFLAFHGPNAKPNKITPGPGLRQLGITAANALCALTDECPGFVRTLLGVNVDPISSTTTASSSQAQGLARIARSLSARRFGETLSAAVRALEQTLSGPSNPLTAQEHTARNLGVLSAAITRNIVQCASRSDDLFSTKRSRGPAAAAGGKRKGGSGAKNALVKQAGDSVEVDAAKEVLRALLQEEQGRHVDVLLRYVELEAVASAEQGAQGTGWVALAHASVSSSAGAGAGPSAPQTTDTNAPASAASSALDIRRAQDRIQALQLALEVLAELASASSAVAVAEDAAEHKRSAAAQVDGEGDHSMMGEGGEDDDDEMEMEILDRDEDEEDDGEEEDGMDTDGAKKNGTGTGNGNGHAPSSAPSPVPFVFALASEHCLPARLLFIASAVLGAHAAHVFPSAGSGSGDASGPTSYSSSSSALLRALVSRSLSAAANALLSLASEAPPTPSEAEYLDPLDWAKAGAGARGKATKERFLAWADPSLRPGSSAAGVASGYEALAQLWSETWKLASGLAEVPAVVGRSLLPAGDDATKAKVSFALGTAADASASGEQHKEGDEGADGRACLEACLSVLWAIARSFEPVLGLPRPARPTLFLPPNGAAHEDAFRTEPTTTVIPALQAAYLSAHSDAMRVRCLGTLGCVGRLRRGVEDGPAQKEELLARNRAVGETLVAVLEALPAEGATPNSTSTPSGKKAKSASTSKSTAASSTTGEANLPETTPECMVAALNALIDLYADERAEWDVPVFRQSDFLQRLRKLVSRVRAGTRAIDKRTDPSLRARADETAQNYRAFVEFRGTVR